MTMYVPAVGRSIARPRAKRLVTGRGRYTADITARRAVHVAFLRSPHPHARIAGIAMDAARALKGVVLVATGADIARHCKGFAGIHRLFKGMKAATQYPVAVDRACWQGEPVVAVAAETRAIAEDALELIDIDWEPLEGLGTPEKALAGDVVLHEQLGDNIGYEGITASGDIEAAFAGAALVVEDTLRFGRHTGVSLEPRSVLAIYDPSDESLVVHESHQCPAQQQAIFADLMGLAEHRVRVICPDVGGAFGLKQQLYGDELATCIVSKMTGRPASFVADRVESFASDNHAREHVVAARMAFAADGRILGLMVDDLFAVGAYSQYPRSSVGEASHVAALTGGPYNIPAYRARVRMIYQNKPPVGHYRAVGHPIACAVGESLLDQGARALGLDPIAVRRLNQVRDGAGPHKSHSGFVLNGLSAEATLDRLLEGIDIAAFRREQAEARQRGILLGIGIANFVELAGTGAPYYGESGAPVTSQESCLVRLEPGGRIRCHASATDQGQGTDTALGQAVADAIGVAFDDVEVFTGDSAMCPAGGGAWASRGASAGVEAAVRAGRAMRDEILRLAGLILQRKPEQMTIAGSAICDAASGAELIALKDVAVIGHYRQHLLPPGTQPEMSMLRSFVPQNQSFLTTNGVQLSIVSIDPGLGDVRLLRHRVAHDSGTVINPMLLDEQIRGGVVQGLGAALFEEIRYNDDAVLGTGTLMDYLVPLATEIPDIEVVHIARADPGTAIGAKGAGEAGTAGAAAAVLNAVNDALEQIGARVSALPVTPERVLAAVAQVATSASSQDQGRDIKT